MLAKGFLEGGQNPLQIFEATLHVVVHLENISVQGWAGAKRQDLDHNTFSASQQIGFGLSDFEPLDLFCRPAVQIKKLTALSWCPNATVWVGPAVQTLYTLLSHSNLQSNPTSS
ncbi:hypothetical protein ATANTOWER_024194 [Ataeniobius toweri]|uniref:Uncharacterized protein n=1 Tax=Ataeniobius toweri TaxID=208326 RepID=A0ABU7A869_9TELE|nr:hypothetical protein [Ataeniobius toweri]